MEGIVNHLFWEKGGLVDKLGREKALEWAVKFNVVQLDIMGRYLKVLLAGNCLEIQTTYYKMYFLQGWQTNLQLLQ